MRVAITGGSGFIGKWLCRGMAEAGWDVLILGRQRDKHSVLFGANSFAYTRVDYSIDSLIEPLSACDAVVHMAAERFGDNTRIDLYTENICVSWNVFEAARAAGLKKVVAFSSSSVYSDRNGPCFREDSTPHPLNLYGASKLAMETLSDIFVIHHGMEIKCLRITQALGLGERKGYAMSTFVDRAIAGDQLVVMGSGNTRRNYIYVKDIAGAAMAALGTSGPPAGIYNIGAGRSISIAELAQAMNEGFGNVAGVRFEEADYERHEDWSVDISKAYRDLGWKPKWTVDTAITDMRHDVKGGLYG